MSMSRNFCQDPCPSQTHCEWGFCECDYGSFKFRGQCYKLGEGYKSMMETTVKTDKTTGQSCDSSQQCQEWSKDINMVCQDFKCSCRRDMKFNNKAQECQVRF